MNLRNRAHPRIKHDLRGSVPPGSNVLREETRVVVIRICHASQAKVADLEVARCVQQQIRWFQIPVQHVSRVNVLQTAEDLVSKVADVIVAQSLKKIISRQ
jgi:hypothetical protein